jgi:hypothetical protein
MLVKDATGVHRRAAHRSSARRKLLAPGFHSVASPVVASSAAMYLRTLPPMLVNEPPAYTVEPLTARAYT